MRRFSNLLTAIASKSDPRIAAWDLTAYFDQTDGPDAQWAYALLAGIKFRQLVTPRMLRDWLIQHSGFPDWLVQACHQQSGIWLETLAKLFPEPETPEPPKLAAFMQTQVFGLHALNLRGRRTAIIEGFTRLNEMERTLYMKWITGTYRPLKSVRDALQVARVDPREPPSLLSAGPRQSFLFDE